MRERERENKTMTEILLGDFVMLVVFFIILFMTMFIVDKIEKFLNKLL